jgi:hypothetical protein
MILNRLAGGTAALAACFALTGLGSAGTVPPAVVNAVHGNVIGWSRSETDWFVVYLDRRGGDWCSLVGASWRMALVETSRLPVRVVADKLVSRAMCGNELSWVRAGRFSDGRHREVAFMLLATPSLGATASIYRIDHGRFHRLASFHGDRVKIGRGTATVQFENRGRSAHGEVAEVYRFDGTRYRLSRRR